MADITDPNSPDLPPVSKDPNQPLPVPAQNSALVPYRIGVKQPGGDYTYTTGYGQRGSRQMIQPPGGVPLPDLSRGMMEAFQHLPVHEATQAIDAAVRYQGQRAYNQAIQNGDTPIQAFLKYGHLIFKTPTGIPEAIDRTTPPPITPYQQAQLKLAKRKQNFAEKRPPALTQLGKLRQELASAKEGGDEEGAKQTQNEIDKLTTRAEKTVPLSIPVNPDEPFGAHMTIPLSQDDPLVKKIFEQAHNPPAPAAPQETLIDKAKAALGMGKKAQSPSISAKRIKVKGPKGQTGTVPEGSKLPDGWTAQ